jgi:ribokinase
LTGEQNPSPEQARKSLGVQCLIVTLGSNGVQVVEDGLSSHIQAHAVRAVDTTAAGDAFVGAFGLALTEGKNLHDAAVWGNAAGAVAVTRAGAQPSLPTRTELEALLS